MIYDNNNKQVSYEAFCKSGADVFSDVALYEFYNNHYSGENADIDLDYVLNSWTEYEGLKEYDLISYEIKSVTVIELDESVLVELQ